MKKSKSFILYCLIIFNSISLAAAGTWSCENKLCTFESISKTDLFYIERTFNNFSRGSFMDHMNPMREAKEIFSQSGKSWAEKISTFNARFGNSNVAKSLKSIAISAVQFDETERLTGGEIPPNVDFRVRLDGLNFDSFPENSCYSNVRRQYIDSDNDQVNYLVLEETENGEVYSWYQTIAPKGPDQNSPNYCLFSAVQGMSQDITDLENLIETIDNNSSIVDHARSFISENSHQLNPASTAENARER